MRGWQRRTDRSWREEKEENFERNGKRQSPVGLVRGKHVDNCYRKVRIWGGIEWKGLNWPGNWNWISLWFWRENKKEKILEFQFGQVRVRVHFNEHDQPVSVLREAVPMVDLWPRHRFLVSNGVTGHRYHHKELSGSRTKSLLSVEAARNRSENTADCWENWARRTNYCSVLSLRDWFVQWIRGDFIHRYTRKVVGADRENRAAN